MNAVIAEHEHVEPGRHGGGDYRRSRVRSGAGARGEESGDGSRTVNVVPWPSVLRTRTVPPMRSDSSFTIARPRPEPSGGRPGCAPVVEVEALERVRHVLGRQADAGVLDDEHPGLARGRAHVPPAGVERSAFSTRLDTIWSTRSGSPIAGAGSSALALELDAGRRGRPPRSAAPPRARRREVDLLVVDDELAPVHARQVEEVANEPLEAPRLLPDRVDGLVGA